jgi:glutamate/tyrosine decarboxylase-like PLP-dependent enzyme
VTGRWVKQVLGLPDGAGVGFVTGAQMANVTGLAAARYDVLRRAGWDVHARGLMGAPQVRILAGAEAHVTVRRALRLLGFGLDTIEDVPVDDQGRMRADALAEVLSGGTGPAIVCAQVGNVASGASDPMREVVAAAHAHDAWVHVDGAFGLWAAASPHRKPLLAGVERADSWATDAHKWLNVPYDSGLVFCAHPAAHRAAMGVRAAYLVHADGSGRDPLDHNPEFSRRARGFAVYAALRALGRGGVAEIVDRCCALARRFADRLGAADGVTVLNDVVLNQVLVRFDGPDERTRSVIDAVRADGTCYVSGTTWQGRAAMRISVTNWTTDADDVDASVKAVLALAAARRPA